MRRVSWTAQPPMRRHAPKELLPWHIRRLHQIQVGGDVFFEKGAELSKCHRHRIHVNRRQALPHGRQCQRLHYLVVQFLSDGVRCRGRKIGACVEWIHGVAFESGLDHGRTLGSEAERVDELIASGTSLPSRIRPIALVTGATAKSRRPAMTSVSHSPPLKGTCCAEKPALTASCSAPKWAADPTP